MYLLYSLTSDYKISRIFRFRANLQYIHLIGSDYKLGWPEWKIWKFRNSTNSTWEMSIWYYCLETVTQKNNLLAPCSEDTENWNEFILIWRWATLLSYLRQPSVNALESQPNNEVTQPSSLRDWCVPQIDYPALDLDVFYPPHLNNPLSLILWTEK